MNINELKIIYPYMFELTEKSEYPISYGIECDAGWNDLIINTLDIINELDTLNCVNITQIKEKFGTLRIYITFIKQTSDKYKKLIYDIIYIAEKVSSNICEICGASPAKANSSNGHIKTLCKDCK